MNKARTRIRTGDLLITSGALPDWESARYLEAAPQLNTLDSLEG
jgi:hypothetical protein